MSGGSPFRMRNWRLRTKVIAVIVVPTLTALILGGVRAKVDLDRAAEFNQTVSQVDLARNVTSVVHELQKERTLAVARVAAGKDTGSRTELDTQINLVDQAIRSAQTAAASLDTDDEAAKNRYNVGLQRLSALTSIRRTVEQTEYPDSALFAAYSAVLDAVVRLGREINTSVTDKTLLRESSVIQSLSEAKENVGKENSILQIAAARDDFPADLLQRIRDAQSSATTSLTDYRADASTDQLQLLSDTVSGPEVDNREAIKASAISAAEAAGLGADPKLDIDEADLTNDGSATLEHMRAVETELLNNLRDDATALAEEATDSAWRDSVAVLLALLLAVALMTVVTRVAAQAAAGAAPRGARGREPQAAGRRCSGSWPTRTRRRPRSTRSSRWRCSPREETGQLARSFDAVQEQAVLMATEQALLRDNINSIFVNLSRRSQALVERQLSLIDRLEQDEQDPDQLAEPVRAGPPGHPDAAELGKPAGALGYRPVPPASTARCRPPRSSAPRCPRSSTTPGSRSPRRPTSRSRAARSPTSCTSSRSSWTTPPSSPSRRRRSSSGWR